MPDLHRLQVVGGYLEQGDVATRIGAYELGLVFLAVQEAHDDLVGILDHMVVGQDIAVLGDHETGTQRCRVILLRLAVVFTKVLEEFTPGRVFRNFHAGRKHGITTGDLLGSADIDDGLLGGFHQLGKFGQIVGLSGYSGEQQGHYGDKLC